MVKQNFRVVLLSTRDIDPLLRDGASQAMIEQLQVMQTYGCQVSLINFLPNEDYNRAAIAHLKGRSQSEHRQDSINITKTPIGGIEAWHELLPYRFDQLSEASPKILDKLFNKLSEFQPDFVLTCGDSLYPLAAAYLKNIHGAHSLHSLANIERCAQDAFHRFILKRRLIFSASAYLQSQIHEQLGCESVVWHPHPSLDVSKVFDASDQPNPDGLFSVGFVAGGRIKGDHLVERIAEQLPQYSFLIAGRIDNTMHADKAKNLHYLSWVDDMDRFYQQIRLLVVPSMVCEGFPRVILEGASHGLPIIANNVGGIPEAMGSSGVLIATTLQQDTDLSNLVTEYVWLIEDILTNPARYQYFKEKAHQRVKEFQIQQKAETHKIFQDLFIGGKVV